MNDFTLNIKKTGVPGINAKFAFQWYNWTGMNRTEIIAALRGAANYFEEEGRQSATLRGRAIAR